MFKVGNIDFFSLCDHSPTLNFLCYVAQDQGFVELCVYSLYEKRTLFFIYPSEVQQTEDDSVQFDDILRRIGEFGPWQRAIYILSCVFVLIPSGLHTAGVPFITGTPKFQCAAPDPERGVNKCCKNCTKYAFIGPYAYNSTVTEVYFFNLLSLCLATVEKI